MSDVEYVVNFGSDKSNRFVKLSMAEAEYHGARIGEPIVRCRDCKFKDEPWNCAAPYHVEPNGFCSWGDRREP